MWKWIVTNVHSSVFLRSTTMGATAGDAMMSSSDSDLLIRWIVDVTFKAFASFPILKHREYSITAIAETSSTTLLAPTTDMPLLNSTMARVSMIDTSSAKSQSFATKGTTPLLMYKDSAA